MQRIPRRQPRLPQLLVHLGYFLQQDAACDARSAAQLNQVQRHRLASSRQHGHSRRRPASIHIGCHKCVAARVGGGMQRAVHHIHRACVLGAGTQRQVHK